MTALHQYLAFSYEWYYPAGGWGDFKGSAETIQAAVALATKGDRRGEVEGWHVICRETSRTVASDDDSETPGRCGTPGFKTGQEGGGE